MSVNYGSIAIVRCRKQWYLHDYGECVALKTEFKKCVRIDSMKTMITVLLSDLGLEPPRYLDLNSELPSSTARSRTGSFSRRKTNWRSSSPMDLSHFSASPAINALNRTMSQNPTSYSPGPNVSTPPASSGPSPDRGLPGPAPFDTPGNAYHRSNSYTNPVNPNTFLDMSPSSSTSSPHRSGSMDAYAPPPMEGVPFNEYSPQLAQQPNALPPHAHPHPQFQPPGMMYRPGGPPPPGSGGYYNPHAPRFFPPDHPQQGPPSQLSQQQGGPLPPHPPQQQPYMYSNPRMMMHPQQQQGPPQVQQQHPPWAGHRPPHPSHPMHYHPYDQHQYRMPPAQTFHPNHPMMSDQSAMFLNQQQGPPGQNLNPSTSSKLSPTGEPHPHPLQSLERLVLLPESQVCWWFCRNDRRKKRSSQLFRSSIPKVWSTKFTILHPPSVNPCRPTERHRRRTQCLHLRRRRWSVICLQMTNPCSIHTRKLVVAWNEAPPMTIGLIWIKRIGWISMPTWPQESRSPIIILWWRVFWREDWATTLLKRLCHRSNLYNKSIIHHFFSINNNNNTLRLHLHHRWCFHRLNLIRNNLSMDW